MPRPILYSYFENTKNVLKAHYERSTAQEASTNLGRNREFFCSDFLAKVLPPKLQIASGEIWDSANFKTGQLDVIITRDDAPALNFGTDNTYLAEGVFAAIEVKSNLTRDKFVEAGNTLKKVQQLTINTSGGVIMVGEQLQRPLRIVFAFTGATSPTLLEEINNKGWGDLFDLICILDRGVLVKKGGLMEWADPSQFAEVKGGAAALGFMYFYLVTYGGGFIGRNINLGPYFNPIGNWNE
jgi:hypothetical protein